MNPLFYRKEVDLKKKINKSIILEKTSFEQIKTLF